MIELLALFALAAGSAADAHQQLNPVYADLLSAGVAAGNASRKLPAPTLADGMSADEQAAAIESLAGGRSFDSLARKSVVAPQIIRVSNLQRDAADTPLRSIDAWFIVHADFKAMSNQEFLGKLLESRQSSDQAIGLNAEQLSQRGITLTEQAAQHESFGHLKYVLLDKVEIRATGRSYWSQTDESIVAAVKLDSRFVGDKEFPNDWRLVEADSPQPAPYDGLGFYARITTLKRPAGALLVEYHCVFAEPVAWFRGTNQLGAKLPAVLQNQIREARRKMMQAGEKGS